MDRRPWRELCDRTRGCATAWLHRARSAAGQGTVEYVGMVVLLAAVLAAAFFAADHVLGGTVIDAIRRGFAAALKQLTG